MNMTKKDVENKSGHQKRVTPMSMEQIGIRITTKIIITLL